MASPKFRTEEELEAERNVLFCAVGKALTAWAEVEAALGALFAQSINPADHMAGFRVYWNIISFEAKLTVCKATIAAAVSHNPDLAKEWSELHKCLSGKNRNKLAHGQVVQQARDLAAGDFTQEIWFIPYYVSGQLGKGKPPADQERLSLKEINEIQGGFVKVKNQLINLLVKQLSARHTQ
jgi:hypothetical protein